MLVCACLRVCVYCVFRQTDSGWQIAAGRTDCDEHSHSHTHAHTDTHALDEAAVN